MSDLWSLVIRAVLGVAILLVFWRRPRERPSRILRLAGCAAGVLAFSVGVLPLLHGAESAVGVWLSRFAPVNLEVELWIMGIGLLALFWGIEPYLSGDMDEPAEDPRPADEPPAGPDGEPFDAAKWEPENGPHPYHDDGFDRAQKGLQKELSDASREKRRTPEGFLLGWLVNALWPTPDPRARAERAPARHSVAEEMTQEEVDAAIATEKESLDDLKADPKGNRASGYFFCVLGALVTARGVVAGLTDPLSWIGILVNRLFYVSQEGGVFLLAVGLGLFFWGVGQFLRKDQDPENGDWF